MDLRELRYFLYVARHRNFTRAAEELFIAQSALSRQIRKLEDELGVRLFVRHAKGADLTEQGTALLRRAEPLVNLLRQIKAEVQSTPNDIEGHLTIAMPPAAGLLIAGDFLAALKLAHPRISIHLIDGVSAALQEWLLNRRVDIAVLHNPPPLPELEIEPILEEPTVLVGPRDANVQAQGNARDRLPVAILQDLPLILPAVPHNNRLLAERAALQSGIRLNIITEVDSVSITKSLVRRGLGFTLFTEAVVQDEVNRGELRCYPLLRPMGASVLALAWRKNEAPPSGLSEAVHLIKGTVHRLAERGAWPGHIRLVNQ